MSDLTPYSYYPDNGQGPYGTSGNSWPNNGTTPYPNAGSETYPPPLPNTVYAPPENYGQQQSYYPPPGAQQMYPPQPVYMPPYSGYSTGPTNGAGIASMVLGIIGVIMFFPFVGLPISIVGLALAAVGMKRIEGKGFAVAGLVLSIIGIVLGGCIAAATLSALFRFHY